MKLLVTGAGGQLGLALAAKERPGSAFVGMTDAEMDHPRSARNSAARRRPGASLWRAHLRLMRQGTAFRAEGKTIPPHKPGQKSFSKGAARSGVW
jgi:hypothetical protein